MPNSTPPLAQGTTKIDVLLAIDEIRNLKSSYFRFVDTHDWAGLATIFCADAQSARGRYLLSLTMASNTCEA